MYPANGIRKFFGPKRDPKGDYEMTRSENNDECAVCKDIVLDNEELERDIREFRSMIVAAHDFHGEIFERHGDSEDIFWINSHLGRAFLDPDELLKVLPDEQSKRS